MGEVAALVEGHAEDGVPPDGGTTRRPAMFAASRMRLDVGVLGAEELLGPLAAEVSIWSTTWQPP